MAVRELELSKHPSILSKFHVDEDGNPISIRKSGFATINPLYNTIETETQDKYQPFRITNHPEMYEVNSADKITDRFKYYRDADNGRVFFHPDVVDKNISYEYMSKGDTFISATKIFTSVDINGNILQTLEDILEASPDELNAFIEAIKDEKQDIADSLALFEGTGNKAIMVNEAQWVLNGDVYELNIKHDMGSENLHVSAQDSDKDGFSLGYRVVDKNNIIAKSDYAFTGKVILNSMYYNATQSVESETVGEVIEARRGFATLKDSIEEVASRCKSKIITITEAQWKAKDNYFEFSITHNLNSEYLHISGYDTSKEGQFIGSTIINENVVNVEHEKAFAGKIIITAVGGIL